MSCFGCPGAVSREGQTGPAPDSQGKGEIREPHQRAAFQCILSPLPGTALPWNPWPATPIWKGFGRRHLSFLPNSLPRGDAAETSVGRQFWHPSQTCLITMKGDLRTGSLRSQPLLGCIPALGSWVASGPRVNDSN